MASAIRSAKGHTKEHINAIGSSINIHTSAKVEVVQTMQQNQHSHLL
jgi:hypothetical protein